MTIVQLKCEEDDFIMGINLSLLDRESLETLHTFTGHILQDKDMESEFKQTDFLTDGRPKTWNREG